jgi:large subunit ribosomal protein L6
VDAGAVPDKSDDEGRGLPAPAPRPARAVGDRVSRIGRKPITVPDGVTVDIKPGMVSVKGPKGELSQAVSPDMKVTQSDGTLTVERPTDRGEHRALHGLTRSLIANMVVGVTDGYEKRLEIQGVGYRARLQGKALELNLGYSHPVSVSAPDGIDFEVPQPTQVVVRGIDKQLVGEIAARIRRSRPPEPYKGKGVRYAGEHVRRKVGKRA